MMGGKIVLSEGKRRGGPPRAHCDGLRRSSYLTILTKRLYSSERAATLLPKEMVLRCYGSWRRSSRRRAATASSSQASRSAPSDADSPSASSSRRASAADRRSASSPSRAAAATAGAVAAA